MATVQHSRRAAPVEYDELLTAGEVARIFRVTPPAGQQVGAGRETHHDEDPRRPPQVFRDRSPGMAQRRPVMNTRKDLLSYARTQHDNTADLELADRLYRAWQSVLPRHRQRPTTRWVMDAGWHARLHGMRDTKGQPLWNENADRLMGAPFEIRADGGFPHLKWDDES